MTRSLNPLLYACLCRFVGGSENVAVISPGVAISWRIRPGGLGKWDKPRREVFNSGEEYKICCPYCRDTRHRLFINANWGVWDRESHTRNLWLAQCFNEGCFSDYENQEKLFDQVYVQAGGDQEPRILPGEVSQQARTLQKVSPPGPLLLLHELAERHPHHHAIEYLKSRYFDPVRLGRLYRVSYCLESRYPHASDRIIVPIYHEEELVGWQARYIGDEVQGRSFAEMGIPKYYTCPGMAKRLVAYNMERAMRHPTLTIVEGVSDVWSFGPQAMALLGKKMNPTLVTRFVKDVREQKEPKTVVILLDPEWDDQARKRKEHPIDVLYGVLTERGVSCVPVFLPKGTDPGMLDRSFMRAVIREKAEEYDLQVSFTKPT